MKAIGYNKSLPIEDPNSLMDIELPTPTATGRDLLVEVKAIAVNPVDYKVRQREEAQPGAYRVLGWDAAGVVKAVGEQVTSFKPGDEVWYAGDITRAGCNSEFHLVDERIVGLKPKSLSFEKAAALPLTSLTAWELLFDRLCITASEKSSLLITGAAGGVGSILVQLARQLTSLTIIGTASREESKQWILNQGAHYAIDHSKPMHEQLVHLGIHEVDYVISLTHTDDHVEELIKCLKPQSKFALIDDPEYLNIRLFKLKSISIHWEMMYTRSMFKTPDMIKQHNILNEIAHLVDKEIIKTTFNENFGTINAHNLRKAHQLLESHQSRGKIVLSGFA
ncbi:zinc-binding alcohol dehydrogenase family protein [Legionella hackeliae]|uniref:Zinc-type alcohol dehydrogenase-like protein n=1 Tax=Legionella hackeliae TaxID=449 RepID=A0A0A8UQG9_LEGHA|nr:zinc-binding alcohol dehydrogenase family protein [Legionella hackeliae]KTD09688.1 zinc binding dehydrogenase [Legionella hackeliae]CEK10988.1 NADPH-quinone reductase and Zn-dependent oxidoreductase [Legionella hackeliae]STX47728.1 NADPH-quinone reductase and Zn-dependent oxidoreductase [Legionella hackeliae]